LPAWQRRRAGFLLVKNGVPAPGPPSFGEILVKLSRLAAAGVALAATAATALAAVQVDTSVIRGAVTAGGIMGHLSALQGIADANGGTRASGRPGYDASVAYVRSQLERYGDYFDVSEQPFDFTLWELRSDPPVFEQLAPPESAGSFGYLDDPNGFDIMDQSGAGNVTAGVAGVNDNLVNPSPGGSTAGCEDADFYAGGVVGAPSTSLVYGKVALVQRGTCFFGDKARNAEEAGAVAIVIYNEGNSADRMGLIFGNATYDDVNIPVVDVSYATGVALLDQAATAVLHVEVDIHRERVETSNLIAQTKAGRTDRVAMAGAHLDSVYEGPGIQDNGSGSAAILEIALQMARLGVQPTNAVRFAWWGGEESGLLGSQYYVDQLTTREIKDLAVYLNFDMIASPNYIREVYDGDGGAFGIAGPNGSKVIEDVFLDYFASQGLATKPSEFDGRSDYQGFINVGIPAGGLFTGAEQIKTAEEARIYGGTPGIAYDPCYHQGCDHIGNINTEALDQMSDAAAHALMSFALTTSAVNGTDKGKGTKQYDGVFTYRGSHKVR
jgi:Zn-dependent M28 family amino/carboxypeptidase